MYEWKIIDGDDPFLSEFPKMFDREDFEPIASFWNIIDGDLPFRPSGYPQMSTVNEVPNSYWRIIDGDDPFRLTFPKMYKYRVEHPYKKCTMQIKLYDYSQRIILKSKRN